MNFGVEVKSDEKSKYTNNIVIEIEFNSKPSALSTTKAKYWVIYDGYNYNWFLTEKIKECIKDNKLKLLSPATILLKARCKEMSAWAAKNAIALQFGGCSNIVSAL